MPRLVAGSFTIGALAIARREANAVGAVRLTLLPKRIELELLVVGAYRESFVPGALTRSVRMSAPYTAVRGLVRRGDAVILTFDPRVVTPHNRFALTHFTDLPLEALAVAHRRRLRAGVLATMLPAPLAIVAAACVPADLASGLVGRGAVGVLVLLLAGFALRLFVHYRSWGGPFEGHLRDVFEHRLAERLAIKPPAAYETDPFELPPDVELERDEPAFEPNAPETLAPPPSSARIEPIEPIEPTAPGADPATGRRQGAGHGHGDLAVTSHPAGGPARAPGCSADRSCPRLGRRLSQDRPLLDDGDPAGDAGGHERLGRRSGRSRLRGAHRALEPDVQMRARRFSALERRPPCPVSHPHLAAA